MESAFLSGMRYMPQINDPFIGENLGFKHQTKVSDFSAKSRIIAGRGIKITEAPQGIIVEACNITETIRTSISKEGYNAIIGEIEGVQGNGIYTIKFITENSISTSDFLVEVNNSMIEENQYAVGDRVLCFPVNMPVIRGGYIIDE